MKKMMIALLLLCVLVMPAVADTINVLDHAALLSIGEELKLQAKIQTIVDTYAMDVVILTELGIGYKSPGLYAADAFDEMGCGVGANRDGMLFLLDLNGRNYFTATHGKAIHIFSDYGLDRLHDQVVSYLSDGEYYEAFDRYLQLVEKYLADYEETGIVYDRMNQPVLRDPLEVTMAAAPIIFIVAFVIALIVALSLKGQLKTVRRKQNASSYVKSGSFQLTRSQDIYLYTRTTRRKIEIDTGSRSGGGGSSTFRSSGGGSFGGRGGKF